MKFWVCNLMLFLIFNSCSNPQENNKEVSKAHDEKQRVETKLEGLTANINLPMVVDSNYIISKLGTLNNDSKLVEWIASHDGEQLKGEGLIEWCQDFEKDSDQKKKKLVKAGVLEMNNKLQLLLIKSETVNKSNEQYCDFYRMLLNESFELKSIEELSSYGKYSYLEKGEEMGAKFEIKQSSQIYFEAKFNQENIEVTTHRSSISKGFDWRVDQDLKIDQTIIEEPIIQSFQY